MQLFHKIIEHNLDNILVNQLIELRILNLNSISGGHDSFHIALDFSKDFDILNTQLNTEMFENKGYYFTKRYPNLNSHLLQVSYDYNQTDVSIYKLEYLDWSKALNSVNELKLIPLLIKNHILNYSTITIDNDVTVRLSSISDEMFMDWFYDFDKETNKDSVSFKLELLGGFTSEFTIKLPAIEDEELDYYTLVDLFFLELSIISFKLEIFGSKMKLYSEIIDIAKLDLNDKTVSSNTKFITDLINKQTEIEYNSKHKNNYF